MSYSTEDKGSQEESAFTLVNISFPLSLYTYNNEGKMEKGKKRNIRDQEKEHTMKWKYTHNRQTKHILLHD